MRFSVQEFYVFMQLSNFSNQWFYQKIYIIRDVYIKNVNMHTLYKVRELYTALIT